MTSKKYTEEELAEAVKESLSVADVMRKLGLFQAGGAHAHLSKKIQKLGLDTSHFLGCAQRSVCFLKKPWQHFLVKNDKDYRLDSKLMRRALIESGREYICEECGNAGTWNGKKLVLQVDHKDYDRTNNVKENLRFLCPNCHTQTPNYAGRKTKVYKVRIPKFKIEWPTKEELAKLVWEMPTMRLAKRLGVSDKAIEKRCTQLGIVKPPRGFWAKQSVAQLG